MRNQGGNRTIWRGISVAGLVALLAVVAGCTPPASKAPPPEIVSPAPPPPAPGAGMHAHISALEAAWHLRAALNVAALSCATRDGQIVQRYNGVLSRHKGIFAAAYATETDNARRQHGASYQRALDSHMTQLYNYFAWPPVQDAFCREAAAVALESGGISPAEFQPYAVRALARLDTIFTAPAAPAAPATTQLVATETAKPRTRTATAKAAAPATAFTAASPTSAAGAWRIQVGAFTGQQAAEAAWTKVRTRSPGLASYTPHYEAVPRRPQLVRLQLGAESNRASALRLCALASAAGFECLPVGG